MAISLKQALQAFRVILLWALRVTRRAFLTVPMATLRMIKRLFTFIVNPANRRKVTISLILLVLAVVARLLIEKANVTRL